MTYILQTTIHNSKYWLNKDGNWVGIIQGAKHFISYHEANVEKNKVSYGWREVKIVEVD